MSQHNDEGDIANMVLPSANDIGLRNDFELSFGADLLHVPIARSLAATIATRADFDLDAIADLRLAVDEACATLINIATPASLMSCRLAVANEELRFICTVTSAAEFTPDVDSFGWRILSTLVDSARGWSSTAHNRCLSHIEIVKKRRREVA